MAGDVRTQPGALGGTGGGRPASTWEAQVGRERAARTESVEDIKGRYEMQR